MACLDRIKQLRRYLLAFNGTAELFAPEQLDTVSHENLNEFRETVLHYLEHGETDGVRQTARDIYEFLGDAFFNDQDTTAQIAAEAQASKQGRGKTKTRADYLDLASTLGLEYSGKRIPGTTTAATTWKCSKCNTTFSASYQSVRQGKSCPTCTKAKKKEAIQARSGVVDPKTFPSDIAHGLLDLKSMERPMMYEPMGIAVTPKYLAYLTDPDRKTGNKKSRQDFAELAEARDFDYTAKKIPMTTNVPTTWTCRKCGASFQATYQEVRTGRNCPNCLPRFVNGKRVSEHQRIIAKMVGGQMNFHYHPQSKTDHVDIGLVVDGVPIAIEYDGIHWHQDEAEDRFRNETIVRDGWRLLVIQSLKGIPDPQALYAAIEQLVNGAPQVTITC